jgi:hypothetical protein
VESFFSELGTSFARNQVPGKFATKQLSPLQAEHVVGADQLYVQKVSVTVGGRNFSSDYKTLRPNAGGKGSRKGGFGATGDWDDPLLLDLGWSLVQLCAEIPAGVLMFFPSYSFLRKVSQLWKLPMYTATSGKWQGLTVHQALTSEKNYVLEEDTKMDVEQLKQLYNHKIEVPPPPHRDFFCAFALSPRVVFPTGGAAILHEFTTQAAKPKRRDFSVFRSHRTSRWCMRVCSR